MGFAPDFKSVAIRKPDLDTIASAFLLRLPLDIAVEVVRAAAPSRLLENPEIACLECGGSGQVEKGNFDHHDPKQPHLPPASIQALAFCRNADSWDRELAEYCATVDLAAGISHERSPLGLSCLISGIRLSYRDPVEVYLRGLALLGRIKELGLCPGGPLRLGGEADQWISRKSQNREQLEKDMAKARFHVTAGIRWGVLESCAAGAHGAMRAAGCELSAAASSGGENRGRLRQVTIAAKNMKLTGLMAMLNGLEAGWGGPSHGTIIGSPFEGTRMPLTEIEKSIVDFLESSF